MFNIGWSELVVIIVVGLVLVKPSDVPQIIKIFKNIKNKLLGVKKEFNDIINEIEAESDINEIKQNITKTKKTIVDLEGNLQQAYDLADIMPDIVNKKSKEKKDE